jgi:signal transduction histidine kinase
MRRSGPSGTKEISITTSEANLPDAESAFMIDMLTEDAVNTACLGFDHQKLQLETNSSHSATLILNIEDAKGPDWMVSIASGSWKRICINLVSNALKYTPHGYINVTLRKKPLQRKPGMLVEFVVEDSGIGMSDDFQAKSLFRPFKQENNLTPGTGLVGISMYNETDGGLTCFPRD